MALNPYLTKAAGQAMLDALTARFNTGGAGTIKIYTTAQAATADTALGAQTLLATLTYSATAFGAASNADPTVATANAITSDTSADTNGTAAWARHANGAATTQMDCSVGTATTDIVFNSVAFVSGARIDITALTITLPLHV